MTNRPSSARFSSQALRTFAAMALLCVAPIPITGCDTIEESPPPVSVEAPGEPFRASVRTGVEGTYAVTAGDWDYHPGAYTRRYRDAFDRVSLYAGTEITCDALRVTQPDGWGPPLAGRQNVFAVSEIELYLRPLGERDRYVHDPGANRLLEPGVEIRADGSMVGLQPRYAADGRLVAPFAADGRASAGSTDRHWASPAAPGDHWLEFRFANAISWNQLVIHWPLFVRNGDWYLDVQVTDGLRAQRLVVQARIDGRWEDVRLEEIRPGARHDGPLLGQWLGLDGTPASRLEHLDRIAAGVSWSGTPRAVARSPDLVRVDGRWRIDLGPTPGDLVRLAARELAATLRSPLGVEGVTIREAVGGLTSDAPAEPAPIIRIGVLGRDVALDALPANMAARVRGECDEPQAHLVHVGPDTILALGYDDLGARYAACRLEERMIEARAAVLAPGLEIRRPAFRPRASTGIAFGTGGPDGLGFPESYLSRMVHAYLDAIYIFQPGPYLNDAVSVAGSSVYPELTADAGRVRQLRGLASRARAQGMGTYWCLTVPGALPRDFYRRHPEIRGENPIANVICLGTEEGRRFVEDGVERLLVAVPELTGLVILRSEISHTCGGRDLCPHCRARYAPDEDPAQRIFDWMRAAADRAAATRTGAAAEIIAFDWRAGGLPAPRESLLSAGIDYWLRPDSLDTTPENTLLQVEPWPDAVTLARTHDPSRRIWYEQQVSHPFPLHSAPEVHVPDIFWDKVDRVRALARSRPEGAPLPGFAMGNGSGFAPWSMQDLVLGRMLWEPLGDRETEIEAVARGRYGPRAAPRVREIWREFSRAFAADIRFDKYLSRFALMAPPGVFDGGLDPGTLGGLERACGVWQRGLAELRGLAANAPPGWRETARHDADLTEATLRNLLSVRNAARYAERVGPVDPLRIPIDPDDARVRAAVRILGDERDNTAAWLRLAARLPELRVHPYWRNWFGLPVLTGKLRHIDAALRRLEGAGVRP